MKLLIVGGGITGALIGFLLRSHTNSSNISKIDLWEAEDELGGRMKALHSQNNKDVFADVGAQYISTPNRTENPHNDIYNILLDNGLLEPLDCLILNSRRYTSGLTYYVAPNSMNSVVRFFVDQAKFDSTLLSEQVTGLNIKVDCTEVWTVHGRKGLYDVVISTIPAPQFLNICGISNDVTNLLSSVTYSSRFAFVMFFDQPLQSEWGAQYIKNDSMFRYVSVENIKRNRRSTKSSVMFHTDIEFGEKYANTDIKHVERILKDHALTLFPEWSNYTETKCHRWAYSQVLNATQFEKPFAVVSEKPLLLAAGDSFTGSTFDNCIVSAKKTASFVLTKLRL